MQRSQSLRVYCPDIQCGYEQISSAGSVPMKARKHRRMDYIGSRRVGLARLAFANVFNPSTPLELGTYHFYACPVCGQEAVYQERWGFTRRVG